MARNEIQEHFAKWKLCGILLENLYFANRKSVLCEIKICILYELKIYTVCEYELICHFYAGIENLYFTDDMKICTLRNENSASCT